ncbi:MAG: 2-oxoacid:acceptor oxidoreductase family protein [Thermodesulfobacteriota bacterium]
MLEVMFQGHGGHGSVVAAKLLAQAAARIGLQSQSFASYGALRRGGKVDGYVRISKERLLLRSKMYAADYLVVMDESLYDEQETARAVKETGKVLINTPRPASDFPFPAPHRVFTVDAYRIAGEKGLFIPGGLPVINTTLLGALVRILEIVPLEHLVGAIREGTPNPEENAESAAAGYARVGASRVPKGGRRPGEPPDMAGRRRIPVYDPEKMGPCHRCQICYMVCPSMAVRFDENPLRFHVDREACAGCGICIHECPRKAIRWEG